MSDLGEMFYTGVGSRDITPDETTLITAIGKKMATLGYKLRSGAADGADTAFELGCLETSLDREIYVPWNGFNKRFCGIYIKEPSDNQFATARKFLVNNHILPWFDNMNMLSQLFHVRNYYQVVGFSGVRSRVCVYAANENRGEPVGGTRTAVMVSRHFGIPTFNLRDWDEREEFCKTINLEGYDYTVGRLRD